MKRVRTPLPCRSWWLSARRGGAGGGDDGEDDKGRVSLAVLFALLTAAACTLNPGDGTTTSTSPGGSGDTGDAAVAPDGPSGVDRGLPLGSLSSYQASVLCEWTNLKQGGYGRQVSCAFGIESTNPSNLDCVQSLASIGQRCPVVTVANIEDCANATGTDLCVLEGSAVCVSIATCGP